MWKRKRVEDRDRVAAQRSEPRETVCVHAQMRQNRVSLSVFFLFCLRVCWLAGWLTRLLDGPFSCLRACLLPSFPLYFLSFSPFISFFSSLLLPYILSFADFFFFIFLFSFSFLFFSLFSVALVCKGMKAFSAVISPLML